MRTLIYSFLVIFIMSCSNDQPDLNIQQTDWFKHGIRSEVKKSESLLSFNAQRPTDQQMIQTKIKINKIYDPMGRITLVEEWNEANELISSESYTYDNDGNLSICKYQSNGIEKLDRYSYKDGKVKIRIEFVNEKETQQCDFSYNKQGQLILEEEQMTDTEIKTTKQHQYDEKGLKSRTYVLNEKGAVSLKYEYAYDSKKNLFKENIFNAQDQIQYTIQYSYDAFNNLLHTATYSKQSEQPDIAVTYTYEYDDRNNWTRRIQKDAKGTLLQEVNRSFEFY